MKSRAANKFFKGRYLLAAGLAIGGIALPALKPVEAKMFFGIFSGSDNSTAAEEKGAPQMTEVFAWGNGVRTERSEYLGSYPNFEPTKIETFDGTKQPYLRKMVLGEGFEAGIDTQGNLLIWPAKNQESLVELLPKDYSSREEATKIASRVLDAVVNRNGLWILTGKGSIEHFNVTLVRSDDGEIAKTELHRDSIRTVPEVRDIIQISAGEEHVLALDKNGLVFCYGDDTLGQCGQGTNGRSASGPYRESKLNTFMQVKGRRYLKTGLSKVSKVTCGSNHSIAIDENGHAFGWGNNSYLQLSHKEEFDQFKDPLMVSFDPVRLKKGTLQTDAKGLKTTLLLTRLLVGILLY